MIKFILELEFIEKILNFLKGIFLILMKRFIEKRLK